MSIRYPELWELLTAHFRLGEDSLHGPKHWRRVEANGVWLAERTPGADVDVVRLFAVFHDAERNAESWDPQHTQRAGLLVRHLHGGLFTLPEDQLDTLVIACELHNHGHNSQDPTIAVCWDADRLDLPRVGLRVEEPYLSTAAAKDVLKHGWQ